MNIRTILFTSLLSLSLSALTIGEIPKHVMIEGDNGGIVSDSSVWDSHTLKEKVLVLFYVDPDEKSLNDNFSAALKAKKFDRANYGSIAIVNMAASWKPNFAIESALKSKQEEFPDTLYVKDKKSILVNEWNLRDDSSDILIFAKDGTLLFQKDGKMSADEIATAIKTIEDAL